MNLGLSDKLKKAFPDVVPVERPLVELPQTIDPNLLAGFTSGEGCFLIKIAKSKTIVGNRVQLVFQLTQHKRDQQLLILIMEFLGCGHVFKNRETFVLMVTKFDDNLKKIIPFFQKHRITGLKEQDFLD